ncbi:hypothetical protein LWI28_023590 [Acer negundo]|uniref:Uncharacterized protein n=1 Tax=Acer negundo TaxID=4023 RepID=A0AAD5NQQ1_ACENE|nr:hypothetical protein LWI28_023590 [Acer negundo]
MFSLILPLDEQVQKISSWIRVVRGHPPASGAVAPPGHYQLFVVHEGKGCQIRGDTEVIVDEVTRRLSRSLESYLCLVQLGFDCGHKVGFELMRGYTKKIFPEGKWDNVDPIKARGALD